MRRECRERFPRHRLQWKPLVIVNPIVQPYFSLLWSNASQKNSAQRRKDQSGILPLMPCHVFYSKLLFDVIRSMFVYCTWWQHQMENFPRHWPFVGGIHRSPMDSPHKGKWRRALIFSWIYAWRNGWANNRDACNLRRHRAHYDVTVIDRLFLCWYINQLQLEF